MVTAELRQEHEAILSMLNVLEVMCSRLENGENVAAGDLETMGRFLSEFVHKCHHAKEEVALFPALRGIPGKAYEDRITELLAEHVQLRDLIVQLTRTIESGQVHTQSFFEAARTYVPMLRDHLRKENDQLFPAADVDVSESTAVAVRAEFERIEQDQVGPGVHEALHSDMQELKGKYMGA